MKNLYLFVIALLSSINYSVGQISVDHVYTTDGPGHAFKLSSGLKYFSEHMIIPGFTVTYFVLYNPDHSIFRTVNVPQFVGKRANNISFVSDALFDTDTLIEYLLYYQDSANGVINDIAVVNENGNVLLYVDSANFTAGSSNDAYRGFITRPIFPDGNQTKLYFSKQLSSGNWTTIVYNLPGHLACLECNNGFVSGFAPPSLPSETYSSLAYPNPSSDFIKIKYSLPEKFNHAFVNLYDISGKLIKQKEIDRHYDDIYISTEEIRQGIYSYEIVADDKRISNGKIIKL